MSFMYPVDDVRDVIVHIIFSVKSVVSLPVIFEAFQEQMFKCHKIVLFECSHYFVAQAEGDQL